MAPRLFQASFHIVTFCLVAGQSIKYGLKGQEVKLNSEFQGQQQPDKMMWLHHGNKVVEFDGNEEIVYHPFKNRITLNWHSAELHLTDLRSEDSGEYELEVYQNWKPSSYYFNLQVIDKVAKPTITCETNTADSSNISALLTCSAAQPDVEYEWFFYGNTQPGPQLRIFLGGKLDEQMYSCRVSNSLSNETAVFTAKDCCSGESSLVLAIVLPIVILLLVVVAALLIYRQCRKDASSEEGRGGIKPSRTTQVLENSNLPLLTTENSPESSQSHNHGEGPLLGQSSDEDGEGADVASPQTEREDQLGPKEPDQVQAETEPSDPESSAAQSGADDNKEQHQTPPCSPSPPCVSEHAEQPASLNNSMLASSGHDDGEQWRSSTPVPRSTEGRHRSERENPDSDKDDNMQCKLPAASFLHPNSDSMVSQDTAGEDGDSRHLTPLPRSTEGPDRSEGQNSDSDKDNNVQFNPPAPSFLHPNSVNMVSEDTAGEDRKVTLDQSMGECNLPAPSFLHPNSVNMVSEDTAGEDREVTLDQSMVELDTILEDSVQASADDTGQPYVTCTDQSQFEAEEETRPLVSSGETEQNKEDSTDSDNKEIV